MARSTRAAIETETPAPEWQGLLAVSAVGIALIEDGAVVAANPPFLALSGLDDGDLPRPAASFLDDETAVEAVAAGAVAAGARPASLRHAGGSTRPVLIDEVGLQAPGQRLWVVLDLSERQQARAALQASEDRYRALYENIPLMYFTLDSEGTVLSVNAHGAQELGYRREDLIGQPVLSVFYPEDHDAVREQFGQLVARTGTVAHWQFRKVHADGRVLWVSESARAVRRDDGSVIVLVVCEDVTPRKQAERRLVENRRRLREMAAALSLAEERERRRIATGLHDSIGQVLAMAKIRLGEIEERGAASGPSAGGGPGGGLDSVRDLLGQAIAGVRSLTFELSSPILYELGLEAAIRSLGEKMQQEHGLAFRFRLEGPARTIGDEISVTLYHAVRELLFNAVKHANASTVRCAVRWCQDVLEIAVEDDGEGFAADLDDSFTLARGFGLFSIHQRLHHLDGSIEVRSRPGEGARILLRVPLAAGSESRT